MKYAAERVEAITNAGYFDEGSSQQLRTEYAAYEKYSRQTLKLFGPGEVGVQMWAATELYAAFIERATQGVSRSDWVNVRWQIVLDWANGGPAPEFMSTPDATAGDATRHHIVAPASEYPVGFFLPA